VWIGWRNRGRSESYFSFARHCSEQHWHDLVTPGSGYASDPDNSSCARVERQSIHGAAGEVADFDPMRCAGSWRRVDLLGKALTPFGAADYEIGKGLLSQFADRPAHDLFSVSEHSHPIRYFDHFFEMVGYVQH
jgi:hypothetical protein